MSLAILQAALENLDLEIANEQARRTAITVALKPAVTSYSADGRSIQHGDTLLKMLEAREKLVEQINRLDIPESTSQAWS